jgi:hypothetical protein
MTTALALWLLPAAIVAGFLAGCECCWRLFVRRRPPAPNAEPREPQLERTWDVATVDRTTLRIVSAARVPLHHNANPDARN